MNNLKRLADVFVPPEDALNKHFRDMLTDPSVEIKSVTLNPNDNILTVNMGDKIVRIQINSINNDQDNIKTKGMITVTGNVTNITQERRKPVTQMEPMIKQLRDSGKTQRQVAEILGTTQANISKIERAMKSRAREQEAQKHAAKAGSVDTTTTAPSSTVQ